jgi:hypothetical protein
MNSWIGDGDLNRWIDGSSKLLRRLGLFGSVIGGLFITDWLV